MPSPAGPEPAAYRHATDSRGRALYDADGNPLLEPVPSRRFSGGWFARGLGCLGLAVVGLLVLILIVAIIQRAGDDGSATDEAKAKYPQSWTTPYSSTSCAQWANSMTEQQRLAAAAELIVQRRKDSGSVPAGDYLPADSVVRQFKSAIGISCTLSSSGSITSVADAVFRLDDTYAK